MKKLGKVVTVDNGKLILKTNEKLKRGDKVYDEGNRFIGNIISFKKEEHGQYAVVSPKKDPEPLRGEKLYG